MSPHLASEYRQGWPMWFWLLTLLAPVVFLGVMHQVDHRSALGNEWRVLSAFYLASNADKPPAVQPNEPGAWQTISMPQATLGNWLKPVSGWLRIPLPEGRTGTTSEWTLLVPRPNNANYSLWLSDVRFAGVGHHTSENTSMPRNPVSLDFPQLALRAGDSEIFLHITNELGGIDPNNIYLGPAEELRTYADHATFIKKTLIQAILLMMGLMTVVMLLIHMLRRSYTSIYGWYALGLALWFVHTLHAQHESANFGSVWFWYRTTYITLAAYVVAGLVFVNRLIERPQPGLELVLLSILVAGSVFILIDPLGVEGILGFNALLWIPATIAGGLYMLVRLAIGARQNPNSQTLLLLAATFLGVCVGVRDYLYNNLQLVPGSMLYLRHAAGLILVAYSFVMVRRFAESESQAKSGPDIGPTTAASHIPDQSEQPQRALLQQEHDALELQLKQAVLHIEPSEGTAQFNSNMRAARHDLQLIRDMIDRDEGSTPGELLTSMQERLSGSAKRQRIALDWSTPLIADTRYIESHYELALARFVQTATLEALAFQGVNQVKARSRTKNNSGDESGTNRMIVSIEASFTGPPSGDFVKRAQMEAAARALNGQLAFEQTKNTNQIELSWALP